jgi:hypothetical protein
VDAYCPGRHALYPERYAWCGNFQEGRCTVRLFDQRYCHLAFDGKAVYAQRYRYVGDYRDGLAVVQREMDFIAISPGRENSSMGDGCGIWMFFIRGSLARVMRRAGIISTSVVARSISDALPLSSRFITARRELKTWMAPSWLSMNKGKLA